MANPIITNEALVSRHGQFALADKAIIDGLDISADGVIKKGTLLVPGTTAGKWKPWVDGGAALALGQVRVVQDEIKVVAGQDAFAAPFFCGFFKRSTLMGANSGLVDADLTAAAGFVQINADEYRLW